jgi:hypothetical protein
MYVIDMQIGGGIDEMIPFSHECLEIPDRVRLSPNINRV